MTQLAAERFELAYELDPDPAYLFNLAQAYRLGNVCAKSAAAFFWASPWGSAT